MHRFVLRCPYADHEGVRMNYTHGSLENEILKTIWHIEDTEDKDISVNEVQEIINNASKNDRAYTTVKTVMDRLVEKNMLVRYKQGKKSLYKSVSSRDEMAQKAIKRLVGQYFDNDIRSLMKALEKEYQTA